MKYHILYSMLAAIALLYSCKVDDTPRGDVSAMDVPSWELVWQDEFEEDGLPDPSNWSYDRGDACDLPRGCGWGNKEWQYYTDRPENARVEDGLLIIEAHRESMKSSDYTSARLVSRGKRDILYGRIEVRAQLPAGRGTWPAIWMLSSDEKYGGWPKSGEIDIVEYVGHEPDSIYGTVHTGAFNHMKGTEKGGSTYLPDADSQFHVYALEWGKDHLRWLVDGVAYQEFSRLDDHPDHWPYNQPFYLILNLAVGGTWGGKMGVDEQIWPQKLLVDYVRVYKS